MPNINISDRTYRRLHQHALSFDDRPEDVILRLIDQAEALAGDAVPEPAVGPPSRPTRAAPGSLLPLTEYWVPILRLLVERGGSAPSNDVLDALEQRMDGRFTPGDKEHIPSGAIRWRNRARFARLRMKEAGLLSGSSHRGVWEVTEDGRRFLAQKGG